MSLSHSFCAPEYMPAEPGIGTTIASTGVPCLAFSSSFCQSLSSSVSAGLSSSSDQLRFDPLAVGQSSAAHDETRPRRRHMLMSRSLNHTLQS